MDQATHELAKALELLHQLGEEFERLAQAGESEELGRQVTDLERFVTPTRRG
jgi:hypothetical protein